ncbi:MAG: 30S ribosomal protein S8 [Endomicrobia bacterium]|nr:30S ribosomal protein S8 [Endomicrobiia bacterium]
MSSDFIADMITTIKNAILLYREKVEVPFSKLKYEIARVLKEEGFIANYKKVDAPNKSYLRIFLKYGPNREQVIREIVRISRPGRRIYRSYKDLPVDKFTTYILSTPKGVMSDKEAKRLKVGGEVICYVR